MHKLQQELLILSEDTDLGKLSLRQIGQLVDERSPQKIKHHLLHLEKNGLIKMDRLARVIAKMKPGVIGTSALIAVPILGAANCGPAMMLADQNIDGYLRISGRLLSKKKGIFAIKASGFSMNRANIQGQTIEDGDYVVVDPDYRSPRNGDYVLSVIDGAATVKKFFEDKNSKQIILMSESTADFSPIFIHEKDLDQYLGNGKVIQVIKKPKIKNSKK